MFFMDSFGMKLLVKIDMKLNKETAPETIEQYSFFKIKNESKKKMTFFIPTWIRT